MENKKKKKIGVDIILPNYNSANFLKETIQSIMNRVISFGDLS